VPLAGLVALVSAAGLLVPGLYRGPEGWIVQARAQDLVDLIVVLPVLLASAWFAARGSRRAWLIWLGTLSYLVYAFAIYAFAVPQNRLFLGYVWAFGLSLWSLVGGAALTDWAGLAAGFSGRAPVRVVAGFLLLLAGLFYLLWLAEELPAALSGQVPASVAELELLTNPVHVLDLAVMLPAMAMAGYLLARRRPLGYGAAALVLTNVLFQNIAIALLMAYSMYAGAPGAPGPIWLFVSLALVSLALLWRYLRALDATP
jgi:hypothetical protein